MMDKIANYIQILREINFSKIARFYTLISQKLISRKI